VVGLNKIDCEVDKARGETLDRGSVIEAVVANGFERFTRVDAPKSSTASLNKSTPRDRHQ
jgi:hypothetical protein